MNFTASYQITPALQDASVRFYFFRVMLLPRLWRLVLIAVLLVFIVVLVPEYLRWTSAFAAASVLLLAAMWIKAYFGVKRQGRNSYELLEHPNVEVSLDEEGIHYTSATGTRNHLWNKIRRIVESEDFMVLMNGNLPLLNLPKPEFSAEALEFIRRMSWVERPRERKNH